MASFCHFWHVTPRDVDDMTPSEYEAFVKYANEYVKAQQRANKRR